MWTDDEYDWTDDVYFDEDNPSPEDDFCVENTPPPLIIYKPDAKFTVDAKPIESGSGDGVWERKLSELARKINGSK